MLHSQINGLVILIEIEGDEVVNTMTDVANRDEINRIYQVLLYFKNVMKFYNTHINGFTFMLATKVWTYLHQFS
jgi:hypothetical protein